MRNAVIRNIPRADEATIRRLGELGLDIYGMRGKLAAAGMSYVDE